MTTKSISEQQVENLIKAFDKMYGSTTPAEAVEAAKKYVPKLCSEYGSSQLGFCLATNKSMAMLLKAERRYYGNGTDKSIEVTSVSNLGMITPGNFYISPIGCFTLNDENCFPLIAGALESSDDVETKLNSLIETKTRAYLSKDLLGKYLQKLTFADLQQGFTAEVIKKACSTNFCDSMNRLESIKIPLDDQALNSATKDIWNMPKGFGKIFQVIEYKNTRLALAVTVGHKDAMDCQEIIYEGKYAEYDLYSKSKRSQEEIVPAIKRMKKESDSDSEYEHHLEFCTFYATEDKGGYDRLDVGRLFFDGDRYGGSKVVFFDEVDLSSEDIRDIALYAWTLIHKVGSNALNGKFPLLDLIYPANGQIILVDQTNMSTLVDLTISEVDKQLKNTKLEAIKEAKIETMSKDVSTVKPLVVDGMSFYSDRFEYEDLVIIPRKSIMAALLADIRKERRSAYTWGDVGFNANGVVHYIIKKIVGSLVLESGEEKNSQTVTVNGMKLNCESRLSKSEAALYYINDIRVNTAELHEILVNSICHKTLENYLNLVKEISNCSLRFRNYMVRGIDISLQDEPDTAKVCRVTFIRKGNKNFFSAAGKEHPISDTNYLISLEKDRQREAVVKNKFQLVQLLISKFAMDSELAINIVLEGISIFKESEKRSVEFLNNTVKMTKATSGNFKGMPGYFVTGKKRKYFIDSKSLRVYDVESGNAFCIVEGSLSQVVHNDKLAGRMLAVFNDSAIEHEIHTL